MTVQVGFEWDLLEQEMPAIPCENAAHGKDPAHPQEGEATHYVQLKCPKCRGNAPLEAICQAAVLILMSDVRLRCNGCQRRSPARLFVNLLTPITTRN